MSILKERKVWKAERKPRTRISINSLTPEQAAYVKAALRVLGFRYGTLAKVGVAMGVPKHTVEKHASPKGSPTPGMVLRVAALANVAAEDILTGKFPAEGSCPYCGRCG